MSATRNETNISSLGFIDKKTFDVGMHFCELLDDIVPGRQYKETSKLPKYERELRATFDDCAPDEQYAEDRIVVVDAVDGSTVSVSDLYRGEDDELITGKPRPAWTITPEGWFIPSGLIKNEQKVPELLADIAHLAIGYLSSTEGMSIGVMDLVERKEKIPENLQFLEAKPPTGEEPNRYYG